MFAGHALFIGIFGVGGMVERKVGAFGYLVSH